MDFDPGARFQILLDHNQRGGAGAGNPATVRTGPITSELAQAPTKKLYGARLHGQLWVGEDRIYGRYGTLQLPGGGSMPVCMQIVTEGLGAEPFEGTQPPVGRTFRRVDVEVVARFD